MAMEGFGSLWQKQRPRETWHDYQERLKGGRFADIRDIEVNLPTLGKAPELDITPFPTEEAIARGERYTRPTAGVLERELMAARGEARFLKGPERRSFLEAVGEQFRRGVGEASRTGRQIGFREAAVPWQAQVQADVTQYQNQQQRDLNEYAAQVKAELMRFQGILSREAMERQYEIAMKEKMEQLAKQRKRHTVKFNQAPFKSGYTIDRPSRIKSTGGPSTENLMAGVLKGMPGMGSKRPWTPMNLQVDTSTTKPIYKPATDVTDVFAREFGG